MKKDNENIVIEQLIGSMSQEKLSKKEQILVREYRRDLFQKKSAEEKIKDSLTGFEFSLINYSNNDNPDKIILLGEFINDLLQQINLKKSTFANYLEISPRNLNKYFNGERKFTIRHIIKLEHLFKINAELFLEIQLKNELIEAKNSRTETNSRFNLLDLVLSS